MDIFTYGYIYVYFMFSVPCKTRVLCTLAIALKVTTVDFKIHNILPQPVLNPVVIYKNIMTYLTCIIIALALDTKHDFPFQQPGYLATEPESSDGIMTLP